MSPRAGQKGFYREDEGTNLPPNVGIYESNYTPWQPVSPDFNAWNTSWIICKYSASTAQ